MKGKENLKVVASSLLIAFSGADLAKANNTGNGANDKDAFFSGNADTNKEIELILAQAEVDNQSGELSEVNSPKIITSFKKGSYEYGLIEKAFANNENIAEVSLGLVFGDFKGLSEQERGVNQKVLGNVVVSIIVKDKNGKEYTTTGQALNKFEAIKKAIASLNIEPNIEPSKQVNADSNNQTVDINTNNIVKLYPGQDEVKTKDEINVLVKTLSNHPKIKSAEFKSLFKMETDGRFYVDLEIIDQNGNPHKINFRSVIPNSTLNEELRKIFR